MSIIDEHTRECLTSLVERSVTADALIDELDRLALTRGYPAVLRCDNGPELACEAMADWAGEHVGLSFIPPGEPWRNGYVESFNGRVRDECLNINIFWSLAQARMVITDWKDDYNYRRRHSSLGYQTQPSTLPLAPTDERLSHRVDQFSGSGQPDRDVRRDRRNGIRSPARCTSFKDASRRAGPFRPLADSGQDAMAKGVRKAARGRPPGAAGGAGAARRLRGGGTGRNGPVAPRPHG